MKLQRAHCPCELPKLHRCYHNNVILRTSTYKLRDNDVKQANKKGKLT